MARNEDEAARRRAKRQGKNPDADDATDEPAGTTPGGTPDDALTNAVSDSEAAEIESRAGVTGAPVDVSAPASSEPLTDFDPPPGGEIVGGEVSTGGGNRALRFFRASWAELQRVRWPTRQQTAQGTAVTLGFVVVAGAYLGVADYLANQIVNLII